MEADTRQALALVDRLCQYRRPSRLLPSEAEKKRSQRGFCGRRRDPSLRATPSFRGRGAVALRSGSGDQCAADWPRALFIVPGDQREARVALMHPKTGHGGPGSTRRPGFRLVSDLSPLQFNVRAQSGRPLFQSTGPAPGKLRHTARHGRALTCFQSRGPCRSD